MRKILTVIATSFLVSAFLWGFYVTQNLVAKHHFQSGFEMGISVCGPRRTGDYLEPKLEDITYRH